MEIVTMMLGAIFSMVGSVVSAMGTIAAGKAQAAAAEYQAKQLEARGKQERAAAQVEAQQYESQKKLALSKHQAHAAASGFSATDPTNLVIADRIERYGTLQQQMVQYGGEDRQAGLEAQAEARRMEGRAAKQGARYSAMGTIIGGFGGLARSYGGGYSSGGSYNYRYG
jgi:multidrug efflux pump subunit AcrA (membrane-fusion protein)